MRQHYGRNEAMEGAIAMTWTTSSASRRTRSGGADIPQRMSVASSVRSDSWTRCAVSPATRYAAKSWTRTRLVVRADRGHQKGADVRLCRDQPERAVGKISLREGLLQAGQAENLIKRPRPSYCLRRTSCRSPLANQMRLILHTAAIGWFSRLRDAIPKAEPLPAGSSPPSARLLTIRGAASRDRHPDPVGLRRELSMPRCSAI